MMRRAVTLIALATAGCAPKPHHEIIPPVPSLCGAEHFTSYVGKVRDASAEASIASQSPSVAKAVRFISPGMAVTMDYRPDRLNVHVDEKGVITGFTCG